MTHDPKNPITPYHPSPVKDPSPGLVGSNANNADAAHAGGFKALRCVESAVVNKNRPSLRHKVTHRGRGK